MKLGPFSFSKLAVALHRTAMGPPLAANVQGELLRELSRDYPTLTQIPGGVLFTDPAKGRAFVIDQQRIEVSENSPNISGATLDRINQDFSRTLPFVSFPPPYGLRFEGLGTIQAMEGLDPVEALKSYAPPDDSWGQIAGSCRYACVRYLFVTPEGAQRDVHVEPLFSAPDRFYVLVVTSGGVPGASLSETMQRAQQEMDVIERLSDRIVGDIAERVTKA